MIYLQRSNRERRRKFLVPLVIILVFGFSLYLLQSARGISSGPVYFAALPFWKAEDAAYGVLQNLFTAVSSKQKLADENRLLNEKLKASELSMYSLQGYKKENDDLKTALGRLPDDSSYVIAYVLKGPPETPYDTFVVDQGLKDGVLSGMKAVAEGIAFGEVVEAGSRVSKVRLFSSPNTTTEVYIGSHEARVIAEGRGGGNFIIRLPKGMSVSSGDTIRLPGEAGAVLGSVGHIESKATDPYDSVFVSSPVNLFEVPFVLIDLRSEE